MVQRPLGLVSYSGRDTGPLVNRGVEGSLVEPGCLVEPLKENYKRMGHTEVPAQKSVQVGEIGFKRIEQRKRLRRTHPVEISAKADRVLAQGLSHVVHNLETALFIEVGISAVHA